jgi:hypothetical protein
MSAAAINFEVVHTAQFELSAAILADGSLATLVPDVLCDADTLDLPSGVLAVDEMLRSTLFAVGELRKKRTHKSVNIPNIARVLARTKRRDVKVFSEIELTARAEEFASDALLVQQIRTFAQHVAHWHCTLFGEECWDDASNCERIADLTAFLRNGIDGGAALLDLSAFTVASFDEVMEDVVRVAAPSSGWRCAKAACSI